MRGRAFQVSILIGISSVAGINGTVAFSQTITISTSEWVGTGIEVIPSSSPAFASLAGRALSPQASPNIQAFFPYSFVLRNRTSHTVIAYSSKWRCTDAAGAVKQRGNLHVNLSTLGPPDSIAPGLDRLVTPVLGLGYQPGPDPATLANLEAKVLPLYSSQRSIEISLDTVVFDDGTLAGVDTYSLGVRLGAFSDAVRDLNTALLAAINQGNDAASISSYLNGLTARNTPGPAGAASAHPKPYQRDYRMWQGSSAGLYSRILAEQGVPGLASAIRRQTMTTPPPIHR